MSFNGTLTAPIQQGDVIGKVEVKLEDKVVRSTDLVALETIEEGGCSAGFGIAFASSSTACSTDHARVHRG